MNNRGLFLALSACLIFLVSISLMQSYVIEENNYFLGEFLKAKTKITNYELILGEIVQGCDWDSALLDCVDNNSDLLLTAMNSSGNISCSADNFFSITNGVESKINCVEEILIGEKIFDLEVSKEVIIERVDFS
jgi:hypothetical protein